jgi:hypothetical protein
MTRKGQDQWEVTAGEETHAGDVDAINSLTSQLSWLYHAGVAGRYEDVRARYGLDDPVATLVMTLRKKIEKKKDDAAPEKNEDEKDEEKGEKKDEKKDEEEKDEYTIVKRTLEVGEKITRPTEWDEKENKVKTEDVYPIRIGGEFDDPAQERFSEFVFLVASYRIDPLRKALEELIQKKDEPEDEEKGGEEGAGDDEDGGDEEPGDEEKKDGAAEPKKDGAPEEPKKDPEEPKKDDG